MWISLLSKIDLKAILSILCVILALALSYFVYANGNLKEKVFKTELALQIAQENTNTLKESLEKQNNALKALKVEKSEVDTSAILKITPQDNTCKNELKAYKAIFKELGK